MECNQTKLQKFEFLNNLDTGVMKILVPFLVVKLGISIGAFGFALSLKPLMDLMFRYVASYLSDKFGRKTIAILGQVLGAMALLGYAFMSNVYHYIIIESFRALSAVIFEPSYNAWKKESCANEQRVDFIMKLGRSRIIGTAVGGVVTVLSSLLIRLYDVTIWGVKLNEQHFFFAFFLLELSAVLLLFMMKETGAKKIPGAVEVKIKESVHSWQGYLFMLCNAFGLGITGAIALPFTAAYMTESLNLSMDIMGAAFAISSVMAVLVAQKWVSELKYYRPFKIIGILLALEGVTSFFIPLADGVILFTLIWLVYQTFQTSIDVLNAAQEQRIVKNNTAQLLQFLGFSASVGMILGSNLGGFIWENVGGLYTYWMAGILIFSLSIVELVYDYLTQNLEFSMPVNKKKDVVEG